MIRKPTEHKTAGSVDKDKVRCALCGVREPASDLKYHKGKYRYTARHKLCVTIRTTHYNKRFASVLKILHSPVSTETKVKCLFKARDIIADKMDDIEVRMKRYELIFGEPSNVMLSNHMSRADEWNYATRAIEDLLDAVAKVVVKLPPLKLPAGSQHRAGAADKRDGSIKGGADANFAA